MANATINRPMRQRNLSYPAGTPQAVRARVARLRRSGRAFVWNTQCVIGGKDFMTLDPEKPSHYLMEAIYVALLGNWPRPIEVEFSPNQVRSCLTMMMFHLNYSMGEGSESDGLRLEYLVPLVTSLPGSSLKSKPVLGYIYADWACRVIAPLALEADELQDHAANLRSIQPVVDEKTADTACTTAYAAYSDAFAIYALTTDVTDAATRAADAVYAAYSATKVSDNAAACAIHAAKAITWPRVMPAVYGMLIAALEQVADSREWVLIDQNNQFIRIFRPADEVAALKARLLEAGQLASLPATATAS